ncbi:MAG: P-loop NTPase fold protein [Candidatus Scalinduaceae bacterium]
MKSDFRCEEDQLGFDKYVDTLSGMITDEDFKTPFCIGIFGKWGSGKTSFMHLLEKELLDDNAPCFAIPVWFNPWRYEREEHLIIPFLKTIERGIRKFEEEYKKDNKKIGKILSDKLLKFATTIGKVSAAFAYGITADAKLGGFGLSLDASKMAKRKKSCLPEE